MHPSNTTAFSNPNIPLLQQHKQQQQLLGTQSKHPHPARRHRITIASTTTPPQSKSHVMPFQQQHHSKAIISTPPISNEPSTQPTSPSTKTKYISKLKESLLLSHCDEAQDIFWNTMQNEARVAAENEPLLASFLYASILNHKTLYSALAFHLANKLASFAMPSTILMRLFEQTMQNNSPHYCYTVRQDLIAVMERDPACMTFIDAMLYFKGFHALQIHRIAHLLWSQNRLSLAYHLQSQVSKELQVDIHPAAQLGNGIFIDHATGIVVGETAVIGDNCSLLHHVTLGGSGKKHGDRHPKLGNGVLVGAGATLLGNIHIGNGAQIGACSLVLQDIPEHATVVGVPAKVLKVPGNAVPAMEMKHERCLPGCSDQSDNHKSSSSSVPSSSNSASPNDTNRHQHSKQEPLPPPIDNNFSI